MKKDGDICLVAPGEPALLGGVLVGHRARAVEPGRRRCRLVGPGGERTIPVGALYQDDGIEYLAKRPDEILTEILLPPAEGWRSAYLKLRRRGSFDFPVLGVAAAARLEGDVVREARIVLGAVASLPREATEGGARLLVGQRLTTEVIDAAADAAAGPAEAARQHRPHPSLPQEGHARLRGAGARAARRPRSAAPALEAVA